MPLLRKDQMSLKEITFTSPETIWLNDRIESEHEEFQRLFTGAMSKINQQFKDFDAAHSKNLQLLIDDVKKTESDFAISQGRNEERHAAHEKRMDGIDSEVIKRLKEIEDRSAKMGI